jgi:hypothetical protein
VSCITVHNCGEDFLRHKRSNVYQRMTICLNSVQFPHVIAPAERVRKEVLLRIPGGLPRAGGILHSVRDVACRHWLQGSIPQSRRQAANVNGLQREGREGTAKGRQRIVARSSFRFSFAFLRVESR